MASRSLAIEGAIKIGSARGHFHQTASESRLLEKLFECPDDALFLAADARVARDLDEPRCQIDNAGGGDSALEIDGAGQTRYSRELRFGRAPGPADNGMRSPSRTGNRRSPIEKAPVHFRAEGTR